MNGIHFSERYQHQHQIFSTKDWSKQVLVHSTETSRTYQSALAFIYGLVPQFNISKLKIGVSQNVNFCEDDFFGLACQCFNLDSLRAKAEGECRRTKGVQKAAVLFKRLMGYVSDVLSTSPNSIPGPTSLMDGLVGFTCHSMPYPCGKGGKCITAKVIEDVWKVIDAKSDCLAASLPYAKFSRAWMHGLLSRIARNFKASTDNDTEAKFHLYSGHDTTVSPLIVALGIKDSVWPGYAHRIVMELYRRGDNYKKHFLRILQNGKVVTDQVTFCRNRTNDDGMCEFNHFLQYLQGKDLRAFCRSLQTSKKDLIIGKF